MIIDGREQNNAKRRRNAEKERRFFERRAIEAEFPDRWVGEEPNRQFRKGLEPFELEPGGKHKLPNEKKPWR